MSQYLTLSRAARLVGVKRAALQTRISSGELPTFEGLIELNDLLHAYPDARVDDSAMLERVDRIKMQAVPRALREASGMPDPDTVVTRMTQLSEELARAKAQGRGLRQLLEQLQDKLTQTERGAEPAARPALRSLHEWLDHALAQHARKAPSPDALTVRDTVLRLMAAHVRLFPSGHDFFVEGNDTILEAALRAGYALAYGCTDGSCGRCKSRLLAGRIKQTRQPQHELSDTERSHGYILTCCNTAVTDIDLESPEVTDPAAITPQTVSARVARVQRLGDELVVLRLRTTGGPRLQFLAGQYAELGAANTPPADYSVASCPCDEEFVEFHIARVPGAAFSDYVFDRLTMADAITLTGPRGTFTLREDSPNPIIFIAWNTGFAPIKSLVEHAMALDLAEQLHLFWLAERPDGHYYHNLCRSWADALDNFHYTPIVSGTAREDVELALHGIVEQHGELGRCDVYLAAPPAVIDTAVPFLAARGLPRAQLLTETLHQGQAPAANSRQETRDETR
jgi:CDP-4-dehydro-6-deoxyglucose reductase